VGSHARSFMGWVMVCCNEPNNQIMMIMRAFALVAFIHARAASARGQKRPPNVVYKALAACDQLRYRKGHHCDCLPAGKGKNGRASTPAEPCTDSRRRDSPLLFPPSTSLPNDVVLRLSGKTVTGIGDSVGLQAYGAMRCFIEGRGYNITFSEFVSLHVVPLEDASLHEYLSRKLSGVDVAFVNFGLWYSWNWAAGVSRRQDFKGRFTAPFSPLHSHTTPTYRAAERPIHLPAQRDLVDDPRPDRRGLPRPRFAAPPPGGGHARLGAASSQRQR
jgi:hypothetical protein